MYGREMLYKLKGRPHKRCYLDLELALEIVCSSGRLDFTMNEVADLVGERLGKERSSVLKSLSRAVEDIWDSGEREALQCLYESPLKEKPTPKEFIVRVVDCWFREEEWNKNPDGATTVFMAVNPSNHQVWKMIPVLKQDLCVK